ncbi:gamma subclass chorismate mutase AroQ [Kribbella sp.]|uniref:gamma subclass chorismate mutase AroQ n=1 Tax=Kribbella sp. TaxID=1871183 RepID=UPI002D67C06B|nr:gamma subclass chorismate mutase AroQ [Kribbella sp.]HZX03271.1 gamma subclass chorismate mutase AroQ [Kribbella sp.]
MLRKLITATVAAATAGTSLLMTPTANAAPVPSVRLGGVHDGQVTLDGLTELVIQRILVGDDVAASKYFSGKPVDDPVREQQILTSVRASAAQLGIDPDATAAFFQAQIDASKVVQRGLLAYWAAHPDKAPTSGPDLNVIRQKLDALTTQLLAELVRVDHLRQSGLRCDIALVVADATGAALHHLDPLHRRALRTASTATC